MKVRVEYITEGENEVLIRCQEINNEIIEIKNFINQERKKISGEKDGETYLLSPSEIYYCESVDNLVFVYTDMAVYKINTNLSDLEFRFSVFGFFRCSKSFVINLNTIISLKSIMGNRIDATLKNGEHIIISRHYAKSLREKLQSS